MLGADAADDAAHDANTAAKSKGASRAFRGAMEAADGALAATDTETRLTDLPDTGGVVLGPVLGTLLVAGGLLLGGTARRR